jgi:hypothetical protein
MGQSISQLREKMHLRPQSGRNSLYAVMFPSGALFHAEAACCAPASLDVVSPGEKQAIRHFGIAKGMKITPDFKSRSTADIVDGVFSPLSD